MNEPNVVVSDDARPEELQFLEEQVNAFNFAATGFRDARLLVILLRDGAGRLYAGLSGHTWGGAAEIRFLWAGESRGRSGSGSRLLRAAEDEAGSGGWGKVILSPHSFQGPDSYDKAGHAGGGEGLDS